MKHKHNFKFLFQTSRLASNINVYHCECGEDKVSYQPWGSEKEVFIDKKNKTGIIESCEMKKN